MLWWAVISQNFRRTHVAVVAHAGLLMLMSDNKLSVVAVVCE